MAFEHTDTNPPLENEYLKLIRDRIPEIIKQNDNKVVRTRVLNDDEFITYLQKKVVEEAEELSRATSDSNMQEEIADIYEVIETIMKIKGISSEDIAAVQIEKRQKRGGFDQKLLMLKNI